MGAKIPGSASPNRGLGSESRAGADFLDILFIPIHRFLWINGWIGISGTCGCGGGCGSDCDCGGGVAIGVVFFLLAGIELAVVEDVSFGGGTSSSAFRLPLFRPLGARVAVTNFEPASSTAECDVSSGRSEISPEKVDPSRLARPDGIVFWGTAIFTFNEPGALFSCSVVLGLVGFGCLTLGLGMGSGLDLALPLPFPMPATGSAEVEGTVGAGWPVVLPATDAATEARRSVLLRIFRFLQE